MRRDLVKYRVIIYVDIKYIKKKVVSLTLPTAMDNDRSNTSIGALFYIVYIFLDMDLYSERRLIIYPCGHAILTSQSINSNLDGFFAADKTKLLLLFK
jgi:hypothetical protein